VQLKIQRLDAAVPLPRYALAGDAGLDLAARCGVTIPAKGWATATRSRA
jgi:dUTPase